MSSLGPLLTFVQFLFVAVTGYISQFDYTRPPFFIKPNRVPIRRWLINIILFLLTLLPSPPEDRSVESSDRSCDAPSSSARKFLMSQVLWRLREQERPVLEHDAHGWRPSQAFLARAQASQAWSLRPLFNGGGIGLPSCWGQVRACRRAVSLRIE